MRKWMINKREALGVSQQEMARLCECSAYLIDLLESGDNDITHPHIAARIAHEYKMTVKEYNQLVHSSHQEKALPKAVKSKTCNDLYKAYRNKWGDNGD